jgi:hypothetical protein
MIWYDVKAILLHNNEYPQLYLILSKLKIHKILQNHYESTILELQNVSFLKIYNYKPLRFKSKLIRI